MAKDVTLADIAAKIGESTDAVSKALTGKPGVSDELRVRIKQAAERMGYISSTTGRSAVTETGNIGVIIPEIYYGYTFSFYGQLYEKVVRALYENKYYGILELLTKQDEMDGNIPKVLRDWKVDGVIFMGQVEESYIRKIVSESELPVFFLDTYRPSVAVDTVV